MDHDDQSLVDFGVAELNFSRSTRTQTFSIPLPASDAEPLTLTVTSGPGPEKVAPVGGLVMFNFGLPVSGAAAADMTIALPAGCATAEKTIAARMKAVTSVRE
jgi:hypothetical protein